MTSFTLGDLAAIVADRAASTADISYTKSLLDGGMARVAKKFGEEAVEAVIAAVEQDRAQLTREAADVLYHLLVMLQAGNVTLDEVMSELGQRTHSSGHAEKASRQK
ncbi:MAG TPA: phosphoribosyl-ATP diphosphatase [Beijerinckiaceae bacterium]|nr:phosphoribosyl-ATP diphosphatase [Beijerinckiaceae bacterium]